MYGHISNSHRQFEQFEYYSKTSEITTYFQLFKEELPRDPEEFAQIFYGRFCSLPQQTQIQVPVGAAESHFTGPEAFSSIQTLTSCKKNF